MTFGINVANCRAGTRSANGGFTLIEVLIAIVVISLGLLGVLALQMGTLHASHDAYLTSMANIQAMDLEERIRANRGAIGDYVRDIKTIGAGSPSDDCETKFCTPAELAQHDVANWAYRNNELFPGTPVIELKKLTNPDVNTYGLRLTWFEPDRDQEDPERTFDYFFVLDSK